MLPKQVQLVMLSATLDRPEKFAEWIEKTTGVEVSLCPTTKRVVPLVHSSFLTFPKAILKNMDGGDRKILEDIRGKLLPLGMQKALPFKKTYKATCRALALLNRLGRRGRANKFFVLNEIVRKLRDAALLPAIVFVFSRRMVKEYALRIQTSLFATGDKTPSVIESECRKILSKLDNSGEYMALPEYTETIDLLKKGIAMHSAGIPQILREMVEILFDRGCIKILFATETFAVGINMPAKSTVFTSLSKWDGYQFRALHPHEYSQMAGRAGRRGIDSVGNAIHLANLVEEGRFRLTESTYETMLSGRPQALSSKFKVGPCLVLQLIGVGKDKMEKFIRRSMVAETMQVEIEMLKCQLVECREKLDGSYKELESIDIQRHIVQEYAGLKARAEVVRNNSRRKVLKRIKVVERDLPLVEEAYLKLCDCDQQAYDIKKLEERERYITRWADLELDYNIAILENLGFIRRDKETVNLTEKGKLAAQVREIHCLVGGELLANDLLCDLTVAEIVGILSCFASVSLPPDNKINNFREVVASHRVHATLGAIGDLFDGFHKIECKHNNSFGLDTNFQYNICELCIAWANSGDEKGCRDIYKEARRYGISVGELTKALLKIKNTAAELEDVCAANGRLALAAKLHQVPASILKSTVTTQSLYI